MYSILQEVMSEESKRPQCSCVLAQFYALCILPDQLPRPHLQHPARRSPDGDMSSRAIIDTRPTVDNEGNTVADHHVHRRKLQGGGPWRRSVLGHFAPARTSP